MMSMFGHPITIVLTLCTLLVLLGNIPWTKPYVDKVKGLAAWNRKKEK